MQRQILAIDKNGDNFCMQEQAWEKRGIKLIKCSSMQEGIRKLLNEDYFFIEINGDCIDYKEQLKIMRDTTDAPIHIVTSKYSIDELESALQLGADYYVHWWPNLDESITRGIAFSIRYTQRFLEAKKPITYFNVDDIYMYPDYREVYVASQKINLYEKEFLLLECLLANRGRIVNYEMIKLAIWGTLNIEYSNNTIHTHMRRLKKKIDKGVDSNLYIENIKNIGYRFII